MQINSLRLGRLIGEGSWILFGQILSLIGSLFTVRVLTNYISPEEYGIFALALTISFLLNQTIFAGINNGVKRYYAIANEASDVKNYVRDARKLISYGTFLCIAFCFLVASILLLANEYKWALLCTQSVILAIAWGWNSFVSSIQYAARQRRIVAIHRCLNSWLRIVAVILSINLLGRSVSSVLIGYIISAVIVTLLQYSFLQRMVFCSSISSSIDNFSKSENYWSHKMWTYSWPYCLFGVFSWMQQASDKWALEGFASSTEVGQFSILFQLGYTPIAMLAGTITLFVEPILFQRSGNAVDVSKNLRVQQLTTQIALLSLVLTAVAFLITFLSHEWIFSLFVSREYYNTSFLLPFLVLSGGLFATGQTIALKIMCEMKSMPLQSLKVIIAILGLCLNIIGAKFYGLIGVVSAIVFSSSCYVLGITLLAYNLKVPLLNDT